MEDRHSRHSPSIIIQTIFDVRPLTTGSWIHGHCLFDFLFTNLYKYTEIVFFEHDDESDLFLLTHSVVAKGQVPQANIYLFCLRHT